MQLVDTKLGQNVELIVGETSGIVIIELKANVIGNAEDIQIPISLKSIIQFMLPKVTNPFLSFVLNILVNLS
jgi:hypothetical protein